MNPAGPFMTLLRRELRLALRYGPDTIMALAFFVIGALLFPFAMGPDPARLAAAGTGIIWVMALLASLLSLDRLFAADHADGALEPLLLAPVPAAFVVLAKVAAHWLTTGLPVVVLGPVMALMLGMPTAVHGVLSGALLLGTAVFSLIGAAGAALVLGARRPGVLLGLIVMPLFVPALIFGAGAVTAVLESTSPAPNLLLLGALSLFMLSTAPVVAVLALRTALE